MRNLEVDHLGPKIWIAVDEVGRHHASLDDLAGTIEISQEHVQRLHALNQANFQLGPLGPRNETRYEIKGDQPLGRVLVAIDRECDADAAKKEIRLPPPGGKEIGRHSLEPACQALIDLTRFPASFAHFVEKQPWR